MTVVIIKREGPYADYSKLPKVGAIDRKVNDRHECPPNYALFLVEEGLARYEEEDSDQPLRPSSDGPIDPPENEEDMTTTTVTDRSTVETVVAEEPQPENMASVTTQKADPPEPVTTAPAKEEVEMPEIFNMTVDQILALDLEDAQWEKVLELEEKGNPRVSLVKGIKKKLNQD